MVGGRHTTRFSGRRCSNDVDVSDVFGYDVNWGTMFFYLGPLYSLDESLRFVKWEGIEMEV